MLSPRSNSQSTFAAAAVEECTPYLAKTKSRKGFQIHREVGATWYMKKMRAVFSSTRYVLFDPYIYCQSNKAYKGYAASALVLHMMGLYYPAQGPAYDLTFIAVGIKKTRLKGSDKIERKVFVELSCDHLDATVTKPETYLLADVAGIPNKNFQLQIERNPASGAFSITMDGIDIVPMNVNAVLLGRLTDAQNTKFHSGTFMVELHDIRSHAPGIDPDVPVGSSRYIISDVSFQRITDSVFWRRLADEPVDDGSPPEVKTQAVGHSIEVWDTRNSL